MPLLRFPTDRIVGTLDWTGSWSDETGPVLASGEVVVPDGADLGLNIDAVRASQPVGNGTWEVLHSSTPVGLDFLSDLPADAIRSLTIGWGAREESIEALAHLSPGLSHLTLAGPGFSDAVLPTIAKLENLSSLQAWDNRFTDEGVQVLASLSRLERLYLEEASLTSAGFAFVDQLPRLVHLGLQDVPLSDEDVAELRRRLPRVRVDN